MLRFLGVWQLKKAIASKSAIPAIAATASQIHFANPAVKEVFGFTPEEVIGQNLALLQPERLRVFHSAGIQRYLQSGIKKLNWRASETVGRRKDGAEIPIEVSFTDMDLNGERRFVGLFTSSAA